MQPITRDYLAEDPRTLPLEKFDVARAVLFEHNRHWDYFARLRREAPVHYCNDGEFGNYWSVTKYHHIMKVEADNETFSSDVKYGGFVLRDQAPDFTLPMFIAMDPPKHDQQRAAVEPISSRDSLAHLEILIRERTCRILDGLPVGEVFNWVEWVSVELTTQLLATLFDVPIEDRGKLARWSDITTAFPSAGGVQSEQQRKYELLECMQYFRSFWNERLNAPPRFNLISMLAHHEATRRQPAMEFLGNLLLLIVGGNDTTRNAITGGLYGLLTHPDQYEKLLENPGLIANMVPEIVRWQTPIAYMRRTVTRDVLFEGQPMRAGDRVAMWYVSGNVDEDVIPDGRALMIDRPRPRRHLSFGFGLHRCLGERLADLQLRIVWEEILRRYGRIELVAEPKRVFSSWVHGYSELLVRIPPGAVRKH